MSEVQVKKIQELECFHKKEYGEYEYFKRNFVQRDHKHQCVVNVYEIPPQRSAYPYHYHLRDEEVFYIIKGSGILRTPAGERRVEAGEIIFFPASEQAAHKLFNDSQEDTLVYIDFDTSNDLDAAIYPDSDKIGIFAKDRIEIYKRKDQSDYYEGE